MYLEYNNTVNKSPAITISLDFVRETGNAFGFQRMGGAHVSALGEGAPTCIIGLGSAIRVCDVPTGITQC